MPARSSGLLRGLGLLAYRAGLAPFWLLNLLLCALCRPAARPGSVLHVSYMVHIPWQTTRILRRAGLQADYLAVGESPVWDRCDFRMGRSRIPPLQALREFLFFWRVVARYEIVHLHFAMTMSVSGWELPVLKRLGRKIVVHYRGCEARDPAANRRLHPDVNICQECDYAEAACSAPAVRRHRELAEKCGHAFLVTTPDLLDFSPRAEHMPFFAPEELPEPPAPGGPRCPDRPLRIVHATNHPGIEGTGGIRCAVENLRAKGFRLELVFLKGVPHEQVMRELAGADLSIGKMKMGYYANAQIEAMALGVPTVTWVRPEFMTEELRRSGFIFSTLDGLEATLEHYLAHPEELEAKRRIARESILRLHDNKALAQRHVALYNKLKERS